MPQSPTAVTASNAAVAGSIADLAHAVLTHPRAPALLPATRQLLGDVASGAALHTPAAVAIIQVARDLLADADEEGRR